MSRDVKAFILRALWKADGPVTDDTLKGFVRTGFSHVAFPAAELAGYIRECEEAGWITGTTDDLLGLVWGLTPKGTLRAQQLA